MPQSKHINYYGFLGLFVALATVSSYFLIKEKGCSVEAYENLQVIHLVGAVCGIILFALGFFNIAGILYDIKIVFFLVIIAIAVIGCAMFWGTYIAFANPCKSAIGGIFTDVAGKLGYKEGSNAFQAEDGYNIGVVILDILAGLMLLSTASAFGKRL